jgi:hypothetical protein
MAGLDAGVDAADRGVRALGRGAQAGYYGAMAGLDAGVDMAGRGARALGRGAQAGWRGFVDTGIPLTGVTEYSMSPYEMDESMGGYFAPRRQVATQRRRTFGEVGEAIRGGAEAGIGAAGRGVNYLGRGVAGGARAAYGMGARGLGAAGRGTQAGWNRFLNVGVPGTGVTEYQTLLDETPYSYGEWMGTSPVERRRTVGEVGAGIGSAAARQARAAYGAAGKGAGYVGRGISNIPVLGTTATEYSMSPYEMSEAYGGYFAPRQQIKTERRKTLGEKAGEWYGALKNQFSSQKKK